MTGWSSGAATGSLRAVTGWSLRRRLGWSSAVAAEVELDGDSLKLGGGDGVELGGDKGDNGVVLGIN
jgi:hypothetical protein